jgi:hypothetical protein
VQIKGRDYSLPLCGFALFLAKEQQKTRIKHLEKEIRTFKNNIDKIERGELSQTKGQSNSNGDEDEDGDTDSNH